MIAIKAVRSFKPSVVIMDPLSAYSLGNNQFEVHSMLMRLIDFLKTHEVTALFTNLANGGSVVEQTEVAISSLIDTWLLLLNLDKGGERHRSISILKSRGMAHSNKTCEFRLTNQGVQIGDERIADAKPNKGKGGPK
jgi:circadian clock protein KaiC